MSDKKMMMKERNVARNRPSLVTHRLVTPFMLSRVADSLYWMSRYIERAENDARILDVNLQLLLDLGGETDACSTGRR